MVGPAHGSGVIISEDGYVLTAAHVAGEPHRKAVFILPDGKRVKGESCGLYRTMDAGLMKITDPGPWPHAEMAKAGRRARRPVVCRDGPSGRLRSRAAIRWSGSAG